MRPRARPCWQFGQHSELRVRRPASGEHAKRKSDAADRPTTASRRGGPAGGATTSRPSRSRACPARPPRTAAYVGSNTAASALEQISQRLEIDHQPFATHPPRLTLQRQMVEVLVDRHLDRERRRVGTAARPGGAARGPCPRTRCTRSGTSSGCSTTTNWRATTAISSLSSVCPVISRGVQPHAGTCDPRLWCRLMATAWTRRGGRRRRGHARTLLQRGAEHGAPALGDPRLEQPFQEGQPVLRRAGRLPRRRASPSTNSRSLAGVQRAVLALEENRGLPRDLVVADPPAHDARGFGARCVDVRLVACGS